MHVSMKNRIRRLEDTLSQVSSHEDDAQRVAELKVSIMDDLRHMYAAMDGATRCKPPEERRERMLSFHGQVLDAFKKAGMNVPDAWYEERFDTDESGPCDDDGQATLVPV